MRFDWPLALAALAVLPVMVALYLDRDRRRIASQAEFGNPDLLPNVVDRNPGRLRYLPPLTLLVALVFMIVGVARRPNKPAAVRCDVHSPSMSCGAVSDSTPTTLSTRVRPDCGSRTTTGTGSNTSSSM